MKTKDVAVNEDLKPDVWVRPHFIITVDADEVTKDISKSNDVGNGLSLRFPRLIEWDREKSLEEVTTVEELTRIYRAKESK
jgi:ATP-dependent DNA ligase